jgi:hypothetical protein
MIQRKKQFLLSAVVLVFLFYWGGSFLYQKAEGYLKASSNQAFSAALARIGF